MYASDARLSGYGVCVSTWKLGVDGVGRVAERDRFLDAEAADACRSALGATGLLEEAGLGALLGRPCRDEAKSVCLPRAGLAIDVSFSEVHRHLLSHERWRLAQ